MADNNGAGENPEEAEDPPEYTPEYLATLPRVYLKLETTGFRK